MARAFVAATLASLSTSCASIISGRTQLISVNSNVEGAQVLLNAVPIGKTPLTTQLKRGEEGTLRVMAPGYAPYTFALSMKINGVFWVNILVGGVFGSSTDDSTGAMYEYEPSTFFAALQPEHASASDL
jgi:hypothetical protein